MSSRRSTPGAPSTPQPPSSDPAGPIARHGDASRVVPLGVGDEARHRLGGADGRRARSRRSSTSRPGPSGPPASTVRHLLAHASGWAFDGEATLAAPGSRRIYSNTGYDRLGALVGERAGQPFEAVLRGVSPRAARDDVDAAGRAAVAGVARPARRPGARSPGSCFDPARVGRDGGHRDGRRVPGGQGRRARCRQLRPVRLGPRAGAARRQATPLDGRVEQPGDVRPLRWLGDVRLGRSGRRPAPWSCSRTASSDRGRSRPGRRSRTRCFGRPRRARDLERP